MAAVVERFGGVEVVAIAGAVAGVALVLLIALLWRYRRRGDVPSAGAQSAAGRGGARRGSPFRQGVAKTREGLLGRLGGLLDRRALDSGARDELEAALLAADVGVETTERLLRGLGPSASGGTIRDVLARDIIALFERRPETTVPLARPHVIMVVGVNGAGKTTSIGKLACRYAAAGQRVLLVAGDTFRAAAIDQLAIWAERAGCEIVRQQQGGDPGAVVYDGIRAAIARKVDVVLVDTAGRLHTKANLMDELAKVRRIIARECPGAPHETLLVLDATTGQNGLAQARAFLDLLTVSGIVLTKLDGTAKGGVVVAIAGSLGIPIRWVGMGEGIDDLGEFDAAAFVEALLQSGEGSVTPAART